MKSVLVKLSNQLPNNERSDPHDRPNDDDDNMVEDERSGWEVVMGRRWTKKLMLTDPVRMDDHGMEKTVQNQGQSPKMQSQSQYRRISSQTGAGTEEYC
ncbi:hypothetical protein Tco_0825676 [Tanacetum coccineum]